jgi:rhodanese-related sulfurtransferase
MRGSRSWSVFDGVLIALVVMTAWRLGLDHLSTNSAEAPSRLAEDVLSLDDPITVPGLEAADSQRMLLLFANTACGSCNASAPYYGKLSAQLGRERIRFVLLGDQTPETLRKWADASGFRADAYRQVTDLAAIGISAVPTVMLVSADRRVTDLAVGTLSPDEQFHLLERLPSDSTASPMNRGHDSPRLTLEAAQARVDAGTALILDIRERVAFAAGHHPGAVNIPFDELSQRSAVELPAGAEIVADCREVASGQCLRSLDSLHDAGFESIFVMTSRQ